MQQQPLAGITRGSVGRCNGNFFEKLFISAIRYNHDYMADETTLPWDDQTELFVREIDTLTTKKYSLSIRDVMLDPDRFVKTEGIMAKLKGLRSESDNYFEDVMKDFQVEEENLEEDLKKADALYNQLSQVITSRASLGKVPVIKAADMDLSNSSQEIIYIDQLSAPIDSLVTKLVNSSIYIGDLSSSYRRYRLGNWLFSGQRSYVIATRMPDNPVVMVEGSQKLIDSLLDDSSDRIKSLRGSK
jgi:predicted RNA-binding protein with RPS1 domain